MPSNSYIPLNYKFCSSSENFGKKTKLSASQKRNKKEKKKERKGTFQFEEEEKQFESNNGTQTTIGDKSEYNFKADKPALIKTLTLGKNLVMSSC